MQTRDTKKRKSPARNPAEDSDAIKIEVTRVRGRMRQKTGVRAGGKGIID
jgi:hypothetical protein